MNYEFSNDAFVSVGGTLCGNGFSLLVPADTKPPEPVYVKCMFEESDVSQIYVHNNVVVESGASAELLIEYQTVPDKSYVLYNVTEVSLGVSSAFDAVIMQKMNCNTNMINHVTVKQSASSKMKIHFISFHGSAICNRMNVELAGADSEHYAYGLSMTRNSEHIENDILIVHASPFSRSNQLFKHILCDTSTGSYTGRTVVNKCARKTVAYQRSSNILLHRGARMNIRPQLEIYADDVKCSHGATVGQLDSEALFYMRSRGIGESEAKKMLLHAFAGEVIDSISCKELVCDIFMRDISIDDC